MQLEQHCRINLTDAIAHYNNGDITAKGLLHFYLKIRIKPGWTLKETQKEICDRIGISRAAFYTALSKLKAEGSINWSAPSDTKFSISLPVCECRPPSTDADNQSTIVDTTSTYMDTTSTIVDSQSIIVENKSPKLLTDKGSSDSPDFFSNSSSNFSSVFLKTRTREEEKKQEGFFQEDAEPTSTDKAEVSQNSLTLSEKSSIRVNISPRENGSHSQIRKYDPALGMVAKDDRRSRWQQQFDWVPDGAWKTQEGKLDANFVDWLAKQWVASFGGDLHAKRRDVLLHFKKDPANIAIAWDSYHREALHRVSATAAAFNSGMSEAFMSEQQERVAPYLKPAATPTEHSPVEYSVSDKVTEYTPSLSAAIEQRVSGATPPQLLAQPLPALEGIDESVEAYKSWTPPAPIEEKLTKEQRDEIRRRHQELMREGMSLPKPIAAPEHSESQVEKLNRMLQDPISRPDAMRIILADDDYTVYYDEEGTPISVSHEPF